eukprot:289897-Prymnesium_polylepis.1
MERLLQVLLADEQLALPPPALVGREATDTLTRGGLEVVRPRSHRLCVRADEGACYRRRRLLHATLRCLACPVDDPELDRIHLLVKLQDGPALRREARRLRCAESGGALAGVALIGA